ncbi:Crp/Fnr family transcriptional regulator [Plasticicumulans sp.]|uniref:Crp/Fnr family transcriptional regulator n=1 Tax=Plasticicumulans sp. TaxID=2307179 RepID=UPI000FABA891|nr:Crp/Fnr family transcriptional regulator [Plasticicumulans sp.]MBS0600870.1 Crp/Fnr family transcriptional regulator [Pseudomonadota bacterium]RTL01943.1 MAG: Crp/Fnr family transcriptional regulator [Xanthomonadales bacterium]HMW30042.1 Crp/Fnr family transcriptional regulator [Plasticicumulans sp.]HMW41899.1 Crp/Fnr family transcriptional regulator [Plasticicumulans sp.]HMZ09951.1 Crp/Fnr family transcriptional regulator [Plasticicumulans sp.]
MPYIPTQNAWNGEADCRTCSVRGSVLFAGLQQNDFDLIHQPIDDIAVPAQGRVYHVHEPGARVFTLRSGLVKLVQYLPDGSQRIVRLLRGNDVLGLEALLGQPYQHDAIALTAVELCAIPREVVAVLAREQPALHTELLKRWQQALSDADVWLTELSTGTARARVARLLLRLAGPRPVEAFRLLGREDIGAMLGLTPETVSRTVAELRRQKLLREQGAGLFTVDAPALRRIADGG